jgi:DNA-binding response OmpR family regulator
VFGKRQRIVKRVLIVEDEPLVAFDNEHMLADAGFEVVATVDRVADALTVLEAEDVDLVMTDVTLSGDGTGLDVAEAARAKGVRVLFAAGQCPVGARDLAVGCLMKPYSQRDLLDALDVIEALAAGRKAKRPPRPFTVFGEG